MEMEIIIYTMHLFIDDQPDHEKRLATDNELMVLSTMRNKM
jgi:hypothetical protein